MIRYVCDYELTRGTTRASGYDLKNTRAAPRVLSPGERWLMPTSLFLEMPPGVEAQVRSRSGLALAHGVIVLNAPGTIDADYRGEVGVTLINLGQTAWTCLPGERVAQLVFAPVYHDTTVGLRCGDVIEGGLERLTDRSQLSDTERGAGGHGSTGR